MIRQTDKEINNFKPEILSSSNIIRIPLEFI